MNAGASEGQGDEKQAWLRALARTTPFARGEGQTLPVMVAEMARIQPDRPALIDDAESMTYAALQERIAQYAGWARRQDLGNGGTVAVLLPNSADYVALWLGLGAAGVAVALLNTQVAGDALLRALAACQASHLIVGASYAAAVTALEDRLPVGLRVWGRGGVTPWQALAPTSPGPDGAPASLDATALYIYTSGTTGLPKATRVSHRRVAEWASWFAGLLDCAPEDRMYNCLPLFHSTGGVVAVGAMLVAGGSVFIRPRFSASRFWDEVASHGCTLFQYIGELCRFLADAPPQARERAHRLRLVCGNGLAADVWERFRERFAIPRIVEFYAATEGNVSLYNVPGRVGAIGHVPAFLAHRSPLLLARCDPATRILARDAAGRCIACGPDEPGEALGRIGTASDLGRPFEGYTDDAATDAKIARDVAAPGDAWFRTGDLLRRDRDGFYFFVERLGETFRWKGENVSAAEVAACLRQVPGVREAVVYGVAVPGMDGRAGMAALVVDEAFDRSVLQQTLATRLPAYARPVFLRLVPAIAATATFKPAVAALQAEGFDPARIADGLLVATPEYPGYVRLDPAQHARIVGGGVRL